MASTYTLVKKAKKQDKPQYHQMDLFSNIPISKGIMNRALTEVENYLVAEVRYCIQEKLENNPSIDITRPISFSISIRSLAKERGVKNPAVFKKTLSEVVEAMKKNLPSISVEYTDQNNNRHVGSMAFFDFIDINMDSGEIHIESGVRYQKYYAQYIMNMPELKINKLYYLNMRSKYSMPLSDFITGLIGDERKAGHLDNTYEFIVPIDEAMERVKPCSGIVNL